jgi:UDP-2,3-diacylglucosamine pyrophosphatase LpxH
MGLYTIRIGIRKDPMSNITLILSDLHLANDHEILDAFGDTQQAAFEGLTRAACSAGPLGRADEVELVINGDCFDFLVTSPYDTGGMSDVSICMDKLQQIIAAHPSFFEALRNFIETPGRRVTFLTGNHDIELRFARAREHILAAIGGDLVEERVSFCPTRFYRPLPDVYIEHGNHYDFWNHAIHGLWSEDGEPLDLNPGSIVLPVGSHYFQHAAHPISIKYAYFDRFEPSMNSIRQIALLSILDPDIIVETAKLTMEMFSEQHKALAALAPGDERLPLRLFELAMIDFAAFQHAMRLRKPDWVAPAGLYAEQMEASTMLEFEMLREALKLPPVEAVAAICTPTTYEMGEGVAAGMQAVLKNDPTLRYAIAGHTHMVRIDPVNNGNQSYLNTASWTTRLALPAPGEVNAELVEWFRQPDWTHIPLRDVTQFIFAIVNSTQEGPSSASLCVWEGGLKGSYRVLA